MSRQWVDELVTLPDADIVAGLHKTFTRCHLYAEPGAVLGIAALLRRRLPVREGPVVVVITGGNLDLALAHELLGRA